MKYVRAALLTTALVLTAGCKPDGEPPSASQDSSVKPALTASEPVASDSLAQISNGMLIVDPATVDLCKEPDGAMAAKVSWNASPAGTEGVEVWLQGPGEEKKLWSAGGAVSSAQTGRWLRDGSSVTLVNAENKQELARIQINSRPCKR